MLRVAVIAHDRTGVGIDLIIILGIAAARPVDELDLVFQTAIVLAQLALDDDHLVRGASRMVQRNFIRLGHADLRIARCRAGAAGGIIGIKVGHFAREEDRAVGRIPLNIHAHQLADRAQGQIDRSLVQQRVDHLAVYIAESTRGAVDDNSVVRTHLDGDLLLGRVGIRRAGRCARGTLTANGCSVRGIIPVDVLAHDLADRTDRDIGRSRIADRVNLLALHVVERLCNTVNADGDIRAKFRCYRIRTRGRERRSGHQHGQRQCTNRLFHFKFLLLYILSIKNRLSVPFADGTAVCVDFKFVLHSLINNPAFVSQAPIILIQM